jgi:putative ABC transport system ATP-binding protein
MFTLSGIIYRDVLDIKKMEIKEGKITCIIGKSGSGKTTLFRLLNNMISANEGTLKYNGQNICEYEPLSLRREILMLPQNPVIFPETIRDNFIKTLEYTEKEFLNDRTYENLLTKVNLNKNLDTSTENLSGGEKQRLALARILLLKPKILLLDEPSSALDTTTEEFIIKMLVDYIKEKNRTLVMVTHSQAVADKYGEIIITLKDGKFEKIEDREVIYNG